MNNPFSAAIRYFLWRNDCLLKAPYFPTWCDTGKAVEAKEVPPRHQLSEDGSITWDAENDQNLPYADHLEMAGFYCSSIISYGADKRGSLRLHRHTVFPMLRTKPNDTRGSLSHNFLAASQPKILLDGARSGKEHIVRAMFDGILTLTSETRQGLIIERALFPAPEQAALMERVTIRAIDRKAHTITIIPSGYSVTTLAARGVTGAYQLYATVSDGAGNVEPYQVNRQVIQLKEGQSLTRYIAYCACRAGERFAFSAKAEEKKRRAFLAELRGSLRLESPEPELVAMMEFSKIRACESIFRTKNGLMHSPGGGSFYAALWTNDQCEYASPLFPFVGYRAGLEEAENCFRLYMERMDPAMERPLVSSIVAEGESFWNGAGDRGDGAMFAYGAGRYALSCGSEQTARKLWDGIVWGIEYSLQHKNEHGVIASDSDELENRFPSGQANLFTSCLVYDALISAAYLSDELKQGEQVSSRYRAEAQALAEAIERFFGANVEGFDTYRYYEGNDVLRAWVCVPLTVGLFQREKETLNALWSERLWTNDGLRTCAGHDTFWDRATLFALRGALAAGDTKRAMERLRYYSKRRLLGEHVPYAVEAWPEGNQKHLSAESALYARVFTEGLFGIRPMGFKRFSFCPRLPQEWDSMALRDIRAFGSRFDLFVSREQDNLRIQARSGQTSLFDQTIQAGKTASITLPNVETSNR